MRLTEYALHELEDLDVTRDLTDRVLRVSWKAVSWEPAPVPSLSRAKLRDLYYYMALTRAVDHEIVKLSRKGIAFGKHLLCSGMEASAVGAASALTGDEWMTVAIRDLGAFLVRGVTPAQVLAQACGRTNGLTNGWDGSLHMGSRAARIAGLVSHLGTLVPVAAGCAFAEIYRGSDTPALTLLGEGATSTGDFHEALNIASVMRLPLVVLIENNQWAFGTPTRLQYAAPSLVVRALGYGIGVEGYLIDGTNVLTVFETVRTALERARRHRTMTIIEAACMRFEGHSLADPFRTYVPAEQLEFWKARDPISTFRQHLLERGLLSAEQLEQLHARIAAEVLEAAVAAEEGPRPTGSDIEEHVFVPSAVYGRALESALEGGTRITYHKAIGDALREELDANPDLFLIGEDIGISNGAFKITEGFSRKYDGIDWMDYWRTRQRFPQRRIIDAPLAEAGFTGLALGAVLNGLRAVIEFQYADFSSEAFKMIVNYAATQTVRGMGPVPVVFRMPSGWAPNTSIYHSVNPETWFASTPGLKIVAPTTAFDAKGLLKAAIRDGNPVLFLEYKAHYRVPPERLPYELNLAVPNGDYVVPIGKARVVTEGSDLSIITYGSQVVRALEAARHVAKDSGVSIEVIDLRTIVPFDRGAVVASVRKTSRALVTCEAPQTGSFGNTLVTEIVQGCFDHLDAPVKLVAAADTPVPFAPELEAAHLPLAPKLVAAIRDVLSY